MSTLSPPAGEKVLAAARLAQITTLIKENQLVTAFVLFLLWQTGALLTVSDHVSGVMC